jgi:hypothetical protein
METFKIIFNLVTLTETLEIYKHDIILCMIISSIAVVAAYLAVSLVD